MGVTIYGIKNCDTMQKALAWLKSHGVAHAFHDYKKAGVDEAALDHWIATVGWEALLNRAGTTFRKLDEADRADIDSAKARRLMIANPSLIKRPVIEGATELLVGFKTDRYETAGL